MLLLLLATSLTAADFESASAILRGKCLSCHSAGVRSGGLSVASRDDILRGGKSGSAIVPGNPVDSMLMIMIATAKMPMGGTKLSDAEIATIRKWIEGENKKPPVAERDVQAVLSAKCWVCHGRREKQAGLDLRSRDSLLKGGKSGPAIVAGNSGASLLVKRIAAREMPPPHLQEQFSVRGLTDDEFEKVKQWIADGARPDEEKSIEVSSGNDPSIKPKDREFWAFQSPRRPPVPAVQGRVLNPIDAFVLQKLEAGGASLLPQASPAALLRRAFFDLAGLPPSPEEIDDYLKDPDPNRYTKLIERLLASPSYGERWGRHWLDAVGYADSEGGNSSDKVREEAWRYRDYVVKAFNSNQPFDKFLTEQIAGDELFDYGNVRELSGEQLQQLAATGFWRMAPDGTNSTEQNFIPERMDVIAGQLEIFGSAVMGLTLGCARCHDHKYDPIPTRDYYRLVAILTPAYDPYHWLPGEFPCGGVGAKCDENNTRYIIAKATAEYREALAHNEPIDARIKQLERELEERAKPYRAKYLAENKGAEAKLNELAEAYEAFRKEKTAIDEQLRKERGSRKRPPLIRALFDLGPEPPPTRILMRGDAASPGALVTPGVLSVLSANLKQYRVEPLAHSTGRRLALAKWLTQPDHPLTARVMVNRIWQGHFGTGLAATAGNFGRMGSAPQNQPLLDWLATEFVRSGWDMKAMHRLIMTSAVYQQRSGANGFPLRRLDAESIRDSILKIAGRLDTRQFGPADAIKQMPDGEVITESRRRSIYVRHRRTQPLSLLESFDMPFMNPNCVQRGQSVVSSQSLHLMNSDMARENSRFMAGRIIDAAGENTLAQIERAYLLALGRKPSEDERKAAATALERMTSEWRKQLEQDKPEEPIQNRAPWLALSTFCHTLINSAEFLYIE
jgi:mono/diheme cytochrome c family protein